MNQSDTNGTEPNQNIQASRANKGAKKSDVGPILALTSTILTPIKNFWVRCWLIFGSLGFVLTLFVAVSYLFWGRQFEVNTIYSGKIPESAVFAYVFAICLGIWFGYFFLVAIRHFAAKMPTVVALGEDFLKFLGVAIAAVGILLALVGQTQATVELLSIKEQANAAKVTAENAVRSADLSLAREAFRSRCNEMRVAGQSLRELKGLDALRTLDNETEAVLQNWSEESSKELKFCRSFDLEQIIFNAKSGVSCPENEDGELMWDGEISNKAVLHCARSVSSQMAVLVTGILDKVNPISGEPTVFGNIGNSGEMDGFDLSGTIGNSEWTYYVFPMFAFGGLGLEFSMLLATALGRRRSASNDVQNGLETNQQHKQQKNS